MSQNPDDAYERAAPYVQVHFPAASSSQSAASSSSSFLHQSMTSVPHPLQVVPAPPPDRPKRKRLAKACDACHKSKRRCDGTAPCSNCFFASKPCTYTDSSGRAVPAPRVAAMGPGSAGSGNNGQDPVGMGQPTGGQDAHPHAGMSLPQTPQQTYGHVGPPYYLPPPLSLPHQQQSQSPPSSHQHSYAHPAQLSNPNLYPAPLKREWNANQPASSSALLPNQQTQSRKRPRKDGFVDPEPHETFSTNIEGGHGISGSRSSTATSTAGPTLVGGYAARPSIELEPALTRELTNLFFTHSHPILMIIHKPSFTNALTLNQVPRYLLNAVCAVASPHSKQPSLATSPRRCAGRHFADEAVKLMFAPRKPTVMGWPGDDLSVARDGGSSLVNSTRGKGKARDGGQAKGTIKDDLSNGQLVIPPSLYTAQALCLLSMYELLAIEEMPASSAARSSSSGTESDSVEVEPQGLSFRGERFRELTLQMLRELGIHKPYHPLLTPIPSKAYIEQSIENECLRRIFWLIYISDSMRAIYYRGDGSLLGGSGAGYRRRYPSPSLSAATPKNIATQGSSHSPTDSVPLFDPYKTPYTSSTFSIFNPVPATSHSTASSTFPYQDPASFSPPLPALTDGLVGFTEEELQVRLPVDETSFEMGVVHECMPEYLYLPSPPAPSTDLPFHKTSALGSELAQAIRILTTYQKIERTLDILYESGTNDSSKSSEPSYIPYETFLSLCSEIRDEERIFSIWEHGFPPRLRWDEGENVNVQKSMLETNSNTGAWCFCLTAIVEASCIMGLTVARKAVEMLEQCSTAKECRRNNDRIMDKADPGWWEASHRKKLPNETDLDWGVRRLDNVLEVLGDRATKSAVMGCWLWPLIKYVQRNDEKIQKEIDGFEEYCGVRMDKLPVTKWRGVALLPPNGLQNDVSAPYSPSKSELPARLTDVKKNGALFERPQEHMPQPMSDVQPTSAPVQSSSSVGVVGPNPSTDRNQLPLLQTQTSLPSLKSSGLLDWSSRTLPGPIGHAPMHHGLPNAYTAGSGSPVTTPTTTTMAMLPKAASVSTEKSPASPTTGNPSGPGQGRSGLSWMMNE